jgi:UTP--glucose-1-phosphate uridylyltransferase
LLTDDYRIIPNPARNLEHIVVNLDPTYYGMIDGFDACFPYGPPSLLYCRQLDISGNVRFGRNVTLKGRVRLDNGSEHRLDIPDGAIIEG